MKLYFVAVAEKINDQNVFTEVMGVFSTKDKALENCTDPLSYIGPIDLDCPAPSEMTKWPGAWYPEFEKEPE